jgi:hypothetical protein
VQQKAAIHDQELPDEHHRRDQLKHLPVGAPGGVPPGRVQVVPMMQGTDQAFEIQRPGNPQRVRGSAGSGAEQVVFLSSHLGQPSVYGAKYRQLLVAVSGKTRFAVR